MSILFLDFSIYASSFSQVSTLCVFKPFFIKHLSNKKYSQQQLEFEKKTHCMKPPITKQSLNCQKRHKPRRCGGGGRLSPAEGVRGSPGECGLGPIGRASRSLQGDIGATEPGLKPGGHLPLYKNTILICIGLVERPRSIFGEEVSRLFCSNYILATAFSAQSSGNEICFN